MRMVGTNKKKKGSGRAVIGVILICVVLFLGYIGVECLTLLNQAMELKDDIGNVTSSFASLDPLSAAEATRKLEQDTTTVENTLEKRIWKLAADIPALSQDFQGVHHLLHISHMASDELLQPVVALLRDYPVSEVMNIDSVNQETIQAYISAYRTLTSNLHELASEVAKTRLNLIDINGMISTKLNDFIGLERIVNYATEYVAEPVFVQLEKTPITELKNEDGFNTEIINDYMLFYPELVSYIQNFRNVVLSDDWSFVSPDSQMDYYKGQIVLLTDIMEKYSADLIFPVIKQLETYPISDITKDGINFELAENYIEFYRQMMPVVDRVIENISTEDFGILNKDGKITALINKYIGLKGVLDTANEELLYPVFDQLQNYPIQNIKTESGIDAQYVNEYIAFYQSFFPKAQEAVRSLNNMDLGVIDGNGKVHSVLTSAEMLLNAVQDINGMLLDDVFNELRSYPVPKLTTENGYNAAAMTHYLSFAERIIPQVRQTVSYLENMDSESVLFGNRINQVTNKAKELLDIYDKAEKHMPLINAILTNGNNQFYLIVAQNSAETRACGGFPGAVGYLQIANGEMIIGDFESCYHAFAKPTPDAANLSEAERTIFTPNLTLAWDASNLPNFDRVAEIWKIAYEYKKEDVHVDGVISLTPSIIQDVLAVSGGITLRDGTYLDGSNATAFIQHDIYVQYIPKNGDLKEGDMMCDKLFSDTTKYTIKQVMDTLSPSKVSGYIDVVEKHMSAKTFMIWFEDANRQQIARNEKCTGELNSDPYNPETGIYFSGSVACKLGWYLNIEPVIEGVTTNADGSKTYDVSVEISNSLPDEDHWNLSDYILGGFGGTYLGYVQFTAPAGGVITDFNSNKGLAFVDNYRGVQVIHFETTISNVSNLIAHYKVTTAPGANELQIFHTPTLTECRLNQQPATTVVTTTTVVG